MAKKSNKQKKTVDRYAGNENCPPKLAELLAVAGRAGIDSVDVATMLGFSRVMLYFLIAGTQGGSKLTWKRVEVLTGLLIEKCESAALPILFHKPERHSKMMNVIEGLTAKIARVKLDGAETAIKPLPAKKAAKKAAKPVIKPIKAEKIKKAVKAAAPKPAVAGATKPVVKSESKKATQPPAKAPKKAAKPTSAPKADAAKPAVSSSVASLIASATEL